MIYVFFVPGMFGTTIEYITRSLSNELHPITASILADGSMHSFNKAAHVFDQQSMSNFFKDIQAVDVATPIYPFKKAKLQEIVEQFLPGIVANDHCVLMHAENLQSAEINMLFQYHKITVGLGIGLEIFCGDNSHNITAWNADYTHWQQMELWQLREWFSLYYVSWVQEWINSVHHVDQRFLLVSNSSFLFDTAGTALKIFKHCALSPKPELTEFCQKWQRAQQYIVDEFNLLDLIVNNAINNTPFAWSSINIVAEAIVQQRLRAKGYEIRCNDLNVFPMNSNTLYNLLEKI